MKLTGKIPITSLVTSLGLELALGCRKASAAD